MNEMWKNIDGYNGIYQVSNLGNVRSLNYNKTGVAKELSPSIKKSGYKMVTLQTGATVKYHLLHRLVAKAFVPNPENKPVVNHKNGKKYDNRAENLEWVTNRENQLHAHYVIKTKRTTKVKCLESGIIYPSIREAARQTGVSSGWISLVVRGGHVSNKGTWIEV